MGASSPDGADFAENTRLIQDDGHRTLTTRPSLIQQLAQSGERVHLYVPFGREWWPYAVRRIGENPRNALLLTSGFLSRPQ